MKNFVFLFLLGFLAACGGSGGGAPNSNGQSSTNSLGLELQKTIQQYSLECADPKDCPESVAMLVMSDHKKTWTCTGFLIDHQTIATAGHCLPADLSARGRSCQGRIYALFPEQTANTRTPFECDEILEVERGAEGDYDYAFLKLKQTYPAPFFPKINRDNRLNGQKTYIYKVDPSLVQPTKGVLSKTSCELRDSSLLSITFSSTRSSQIQYGGCLTVSGNSGAPVMNNRGEIVAIHNSSTKPSSDLALILSQYSKPAQTNEFGTATNFGCLCRQGESYRRCLMSSSCRSQNDAEYLLGNRQLVLDRKWSQYQRRLKLPEQMNQQISDDQFEWQTTLHFEQSAKDFQLYLTKRPVCLKPEYKFSDIPFQRNKLVKKNIPVCHLQMTLDASYEITSLSTDETKCSLREVHFELNHPIDLELKAQIINERNEKKLNPFSMGRKIPYCP